MSLTTQQKQKKSDTSYWDDLRGKIHTRMGGWIIGEAVYNHGYSMLDELVGKATFFQVLILNVTGTLPDKRIADWMEALFICLSWPDARIWCNQVGSLAGTMRTSPVVAVGAATIASDSRMYGPGVVMAGIEFISQALAQKKNGVSVEDIVDNYPKTNEAGIPVIPGYVRPIASGDERVEAMEKVTTKLGFSRGEHSELAFLIQQSMLDKFNEGMNLLGYCVAFLLDQGFRPAHIHRCLSAWVISGVHACYGEAADKPAGSFFPLQCNDITYCGNKERPVPKE